MNRLALIAALVVGLAAPAAAQTITVSIAKDASSVERALVLRAVNEWNVALDGGGRFEIVQGNAQWQVVFANGRSQPGVGCTAGTTGMGFVTLYLRCIGGAGRLHATLLHEFGHTLGLPHIEGGIMAATCCHNGASIDPLTAKLARVYLNARARK